MRPISDKLPDWIVIGFSGHRNLYGRDEETAAQINKALDDLTKLNPRIAGICSAASGADTLFAEEMLRRGAPLSVILPFGVDRFQEDFRDQPPESWDRSRQIILQARRLDVVHQIDTDLADVKELGLTATERDETKKVRDDLAYYEATIRTVEHCDVLLAVWNQRTGEGIGGTASAVDYADKLDKPKIIYNPEIGKCYEQRLAKLTHLQSKAEFDLSNPRQLVANHADSVNALAKAHAEKSRAEIKTYIYLHLAAASAASATLVFGSSLFEEVRYVPAIVELAVLAYAWYLVWTRGEHFKVWLHQRVRAEVCRTFLGTWDVRRHPTLIRQPRPPLPSQDRLFRQLRLLRQLDRSTIPPLKTVRETYLKDRIEDQIKYFRKYLAPARRSFRLYSGVSEFASLASIVVAVVVFVLVIRGQKHELSVRSFEWLGTILPLVVTAASLMMISQESSRRTRRYKVMVEALEKAKPMVDAAPTWDALSRAVTEVEEAMLQEIVEWEAFVENTEHLH